MYIIFVLNFYTRGHECLKICFELRAKKCLPIPAPFPIVYAEREAIKIDILHTQSKTFPHSQSAAVQ